MQQIADARLNAVYGSWANALKHPAPADAKDDAEVLKRLIVAERAWNDFRDKDCDLQSTSALGGTGESGAFGDCRYTLTKARVTALESASAARYRVGLTSEAASCASVQSPPHLGITNVRSRTGFAPLAADLGLGAHLCPF